MRRSARRCKVMGYDPGMKPACDPVAIFRGHRQLTRDPALLGKVKTLITQRRMEARVALQEVLAEYAHLFAQIQDEYLRDRMADIRDVVARISAHLSLEARPAQL